MASIWTGVDMDLEQQVERLKLKFVAAYERLLKRGELTEDQFEKIVEVIDELESYSPDELSRELERIVEARDTSETR